jgi:hypothetical protein
MFLPSADAIRQMLTSGGSEKAVRWHLFLKAQKPSKGLTPLDPISPEILISDPAKAFRPCLLRSSA